MKSSLLCALVLAGCGTSPASSAKLYSASHQANVTIEEVVTEFQRAYGRKVTVPVMLVSPQEIERQGTGAGTVALCVTETENGSIVIVDSDFWYSTDNATRWTLVFHELGHCVLNRPHLDTIDPVSKCPVSVMRWILDFTALCVETGRRTTVDYEIELFGKKAE